MKLKFYTLLLFSIVMVVRSSSAAELIPFSLPWDDSSETITDRSGLLEKPAGKDGFIHIEDGHFVDGEGKRFRILGVNTAFDGNFPTHEQVEKVAARMAKFGINCVRFHHMDTSRSPRGLWKANTDAKQELDFVRLDRLDYFIYQLKQNGIYSNINLKVGRKTVEADGLPEADELPRYDKGPDHYVPRLIELQKDFARDLLTHYNPYTKSRYVDEPAIATIEINNESGLVQKWGNGTLDDIPSRYLEPLQTDWNNFLRAKYDTTDNLRKAWTTEVTGSGEELLTRELNGWTFQQIEEGKGRKEIVSEGPDGENCLKITTTGRGEQGWHVQLFYPRLSLKQSGIYRVVLWMRANRTRDVSVGIQMNHTPWNALDDSVSIDVRRDWQRYEFAFSPRQSDSDARLDISDLGDELGTLWIARPSMIVGSPEGLGENERLQDGSVSVILREDYAKKGQTVKRDWMEFLVEREAQYYREMVDFLKNELGAKSVIGGTQLGFGTYVAQMETDFIDHHAYWQHPVFPGRSWDPNNWYVRNVSMLNKTDNPLERMMLARVEDRPFTVSEYNHPAPNTYASEAIPLLSAYAAFQDWDGIYYFAYSHNDDYDDKSINSFFDIAGHTPKMLAMPAAANMVIRGDIASASEVIVGLMSRSEFIDTVTERAGSLWNIGNLITHIPETAPYIHRTVIRYGLEPEAVTNPYVSRSRRNLESDTEELMWDNNTANRSFLLIRSERTKGFVGFTNGNDFDLGHGIRLAIGETIQDWANVLLTYIRSDEQGTHWLLTSTGYAENKGMVWTNDEKESVKSHWGEGPPLVEPIPLRLTFSEKDSQPCLFSLNEWGGRSGEIMDGIQMDDDGSAVIDLTQKPAALWYEIVFEKERIPNSRLY